MWLLTGDPGIGKTTVITRVIRLLRSEPLVVGGVTSREIRISGAREGFEIMDLSSERRDRLASIHQKEGPRMGRYRVNLRGLAEIAANAITHALQKSEVVVCDEVGPMELLSPEFRRAVREMASSPKPILAAIHKQMQDPVILELRNAEDAEVLEVTAENRDELPSLLTSKILTYLTGHASPSQE